MKTAESSAMDWMRNVTDCPITTEAELRAILPEPNAKIRLKILDRLERHSQAMITLSSLAVLSCARNAAGAPVALVTACGSIVPQGDRALRIDDADGALRVAWDLGHGERRGIGGLFMVAGIPETLRVNGRATPSPDGGGVTMEVEEAFLQCPKAFVRSRLWDTETWDTETWDTETWETAAQHGDGPSSTLTTAMRAFVDKSPFAVVCTESADGHGDVSPRGDPPGLFVRCLSESTLLLPDRTGNQLADTLRNVIATPRAVLIFLLPGVADALQVTAAVRVVADEALLAPSAVQGKVPKLGILLEVEEAQFLCGALAPLWNPAGLVDPRDFPTMGEMILDQINPGGRTLNRIGSAIYDLASGYHKKWRLY